MSTLTDTGFWQRFWARITGKARLDKGGKTYPYAGTGSASGATVTPESALTLSAVLACVRLRAETIASLPLHLRDDTKSIAKDHPLYDILHFSPNYNMSAFEFWVSQVASMDLWGNGYSQIMRNSSGRVIALEPLDPSRMIVRRDDFGALSYCYENGEKTENFTEDQILHLRGFSLDGIVGLSVIQYAADTIGFQMDANRTAQTEFKNGLKASGFLQSGERTLTTKQRTDLEASLARFSLPENSGKMMVLEAGMNVAANPYRIKPSDAQLLESRCFGIEEICRMFGVPPQLIGHTDKSSSWASSLENTNLGFLTYGIAPTLRKIEQTISRKLLLASERKEFRPKFSVNGLLRADSQSRGTFYSQMLQNGVMSRNEVRELEDLQRVEGADELTAQLNLTTVDKIGATE